MDNGWVEIISGPPCDSISEIKTNKSNTGLRVFLMAVIQIHITVDSLWTQKDLMLMKQAEKVTQ